MNCSDLNELIGLQFIPVDANKVPVVKDWQLAIKKYDLSNVAGVGLVCGVPSGNVESLDFDLKYSLTPDLMDRYKDAVHRADSSLLKLLVVQKTRNNGYHFIYRCSVIAGNSKLAMRPITEKEKQSLYEKTFQANLKDGMSEVDAKKIAERVVDKNKKIGIIETRGAKGQIVVAPSIGYEFTFGDLCSIVDITPEQREILHSVARQFNECIDEVIVPKTQVPKPAKKGGISSFDDYNQNGDVVSLLQSHGWKIVSQKGKKIHFLRPGQATSQTSGNWDYEMERFSVFTINSVFEPERGYQKYAVFAMLECDGDFSEASRRLKAMGFGKEDEAVVKEKAPSTRQIQSRVNPDDNDLSFLATPADYDEYLQMAMDGTLPMGLTTGSPALDQYFLFKQGEFVMDNGHDNTGKSIFVWYLELLAALYHGWKGIVFSSENTLGAFMRKMIQFYWGKPIRGYGAMSREQFHIAKSFIEKHFILIKAQEDLFNYKDILNMVKKALKEYRDLNWGMIDPYNSLKTDLSGFSKLSTHEYHYEALSELKSFGQVNKFGWFINHHAITEALRRQDKEGYPVAPNKADTEGGGKVSNKADSFITIHRKTQHPDDWNVTEIHVRKIKDTETGGRPTPMENPILFRMNKNGCGFTEELPLGGMPVDPVQRWHQTRTAKTEEEKHWADRKDHQTFEQFKESEKVEKAIDFYKKVNPQTIAEGYVPDDEEKAELERMKKNGNLF